jgi:hypothetical protein
MLIPWHAASLWMYVITAFVTAALAIACWRSHMPLSLRYSALLLATVLITPHLTIYDLVILVPAFLLIADWIVTQPENLASPVLKLLLYFAFLLPLLGPLARWTHFQISVPVMAVLLFEIWRIGAREKPATSLKLHTENSAPRESAPPRPIRYGPHPL